jgi:5-methylcytosine-specific restriction endonuclease McrA
MIRKFLSLFVALMIALSPILAEGKSYYSSYGRSSHNSRSTYKSVPGNFSHGSKTYGSQRSIPHPKSTFKTGGTKYNYNETYKNSRFPKVKRSEVAKRKFLKSKGYKRVPAGYEVDHIIPLSKGGRDEPSNMQLIPKSVHKRKTAGERKR